jgi:hypothetical protein
MFTCIVQEDLHAYVSASGATLAKYLSERKIFLRKVAENNKTRVLTAYHFSPDLTPFVIIQQMRRHANISHFSQELKHNVC